MPGTPTFIPITPRPLGITAGAILMIIAVWMLAGYLPGSRVRVSAGQATGGLGDEWYYAGNVAATALLLIGFVVALGSALYRAQIEVLCRVCHRQVIGWKSSFGLLCPLERHYARINWLTLAATGMFWLLTAGFLIIVAILAYA